jgi:hypothetical protein
MKLAIIGAVVVAGGLTLAAQADEPLRRDASALFGQIHAQRLPRRRRSTVFSRVTTAH